MSQAVLQGMPTVSIYGIRFSKMNMTDTVHYLTDRVERREPTQVITGNPIMIMTALEQQSFHKVMLEAELVVPDGTGVVWAASYIGDPVTERVAGFDLLHRLMEVGEKRSWRVFLLGTTQEIIEQTAQKLQQQYPGVTIAGYRNGYFGAAEDTRSSSTYGRLILILCSLPVPLIHRSRGLPSTKQRLAFPSLWVLAAALM